MFKLKLLSKLNYGKFGHREFYVEHVKCISNLKWRRRNKLSANPNCDATLRDEADFTYANGKPTPYNVHQRIRIIKQMDYGKQVINLLQKVQQCKEAYQCKLETEKQNVQNYLSRKLKPKGPALLNRKRTKNADNTENNN